jgi:hypothetical protein
MCPRVLKGPFQLPRHRSRNVYPLFQLVKRDNGLSSVRNRCVVEQAKVQNTELTSRSKSVHITFATYQDTYFVAANFKLLMISACNIKATW